MGRDSGKGDLRIPRGWERASSPANYKSGWVKAFRDKNPLDDYCKRCHHTHGWCECDDNTCKEIPDAQRKR